MIALWLLACGAVGVAPRDGSPSRDAEMRDGTLDVTLPSGIEPLGDLYRDGATDAAVGRCGAVDLYSGPLQDVGAPIAHVASTSCAQVLAADLDGHDSLVVVRNDIGANLVAIVFESPPVGEVDADAIPGSYVAGPVRQVVDADDDGAADLLLDYQGFSLVLAEGTPSDGHAHWQPGPIWSYGSASCCHYEERSPARIADYDGDGIGDLAAANAYQMWVETSPSPGVHDLDEGYAIGDTVEHGGAVVIGDVGDADGDRYTDLLWADRHGVVLLFDGPITGDRPSSAAEASFVTADGEALEGWTACPGDTNGDGDPDVALAGVSSGVWLAHGPFHGTVVLTDGMRVTSHTGELSAAGDVLGDGGSYLFVDDASQTWIVGTW